MKQYILSVLGTMTLFVSKAQQNQGKVMYDRTVKVQFSFAGMGGGAEQQVPSTRTDKYELLFGNGQSLWKTGRKRTRG
jgi:hypothetical protein